MLLQKFLADADEDEANTAKHCFTIAYSLVFLRDVLGIAGNDTRISFASAVPQLDGGEPVPLDWPLGAMLTQAALLQQSGSAALQAPLEAGRQNVKQRAKEGGLRLKGVSDGAGQQERGVDAPAAPGRWWLLQAALICAALAGLCVALVALLRCALIAISLSPAAWCHERTAQARGVWTSGHRLVMPVWCTC